MIANEPFWAYLLLQLEHQEFGNEIMGIALSLAYNPDFISGSAAAYHRNIFNAAREIVVRKRAAASQVWRRVGREDDQKRTENLLRQIAQLLADQEMDSYDKYQQVSMRVTALKMIIIPGQR
ncbi:MAG: hypothetical protein PVJ09_04275 [Candidatus Woesebacteria bacterium]